MKALLIVALIGTSISADTILTNLGDDDAQFTRYSAHYALPIEVELAAGETLHSTVDIALYFEDHAGDLRGEQVSITGVVNGNALAFRHDLDAAGHFFPSRRDASSDSGWRYRLGFGWNVRPLDIDNNDFLSIQLGNGESLPVAHAEYVNIQLLVPDSELGDASNDPITVDTSFVFASAQTSVRSISANTTGIPLMIVPEPSGKELQLGALFCLIVVGRLLGLGRRSLNSSSVSQPPAARLLAHADLTRHAV